MRKELKSVQTSVAAMVFAALLSALSAGAWAQPTEFKIENPQEGYRTGEMGRGVAVDGDTMIAGAPYSDPNGLAAAGAARAYRADGLGSWTLEAELTAADAEATNFFGVSVSISGDTTVVGAHSDSRSGSASGSAYVFTRSGGVWTQQQKLTASDAAWDDQFGNSVSVSGDTVVVGAMNDDDAGRESGSAYVFTRSGGVWTEQQKLTASDAATFDAFGCSVSVSGDTAVIGAHGDDEGASASGSAYVFTRSGGVWTQQQKLTASDAPARDFFGASVSISADTAIIGAAGDDDNGSASGSAYVFTRSGGVWTQQQKLTAPDPAGFDYFGISVSVSGDTAVVGATGDDDGGDGAACVFTRSGGVWTQQQKLTPSDAPEGGNSFGYSVSVLGDTVIVGSSQSDDVGSSPGSAYVFTRSGGVWTQQQRLAASDAMPSDDFGYSVSVSRDTAVVGACSALDRGGDSGAAYIFTRSGGAWTQQPKLVSVDAAEDDQFGYSVSVSGDTAIVAAYNDNSYCGSAYVFTRTIGVWIQQQKLTASDAAARDRFGNCVSVSGDTAVIGAYQDDDGGTDSGSAYVFTRSGGVWTQQQKLTASDAADYDYFGGAVSVSGDTVVVGADGNDDGGSGSGSAYVFTRSGGVWTQQQKLTASDAAQYDDFGNSVSVSGDTAVVGAPGDNTYTGSAYVFTHAGGVWTQQQKLTAFDHAGYDYFGNSVSVSGNTAVVGAYGDSDGGRISGAAYVFTRSGGAWTQRRKLTALDAAAGDYFGLSVSVSGDTAVVGAHHDDDAGSNSGSAYLFTHSGGVWTQQYKLTASDAASGDSFGRSVATDAGRVAVGAYGNDDPEPDSGAAYIFSLIPPQVTGAGWALH